MTFEIVVIMLIIIAIMGEYLRRLVEGFDKPKNGGGGFLRELTEEMGDRKTVFEGDIPRLSSLVDSAGKSGEFMFTKEGIYSISAPPRAREIANNIAKFHREPSQLTIIDGTACNGGDTIAFARKFKRVYSVEISPENYSALKHNVSIYPKLAKKITPILGDLRKVIAEPPKPLPNIVHMDPPWGGLDYKSGALLRLNLGDSPLTDVVKNLAAWETPPHISLKVPRNFDVEWLNEALPNWQAHRIEIRGMLLLHYLP